MKKTSNILPIISYLYLIIPILIFFIGWCRPLIAIIGTIIILTSLYFTIKNAPKIQIPQTKKEIWFFISIFLIALIWVYLSGIGALVYQNPDHACRNPIYELLVTNSWPVVHEKEPAILTYYIAFWLPSAVVGKIFNSIQIGYYFQIFWATLGIFLFFCYVFTFLKKRSFIPIIIFIFFSGLDVIGAMFTSEHSSVFNLTTHLEWWITDFQFSSITTQLFWVYNQAIAAWLIVPLLFIEKNNKSIVFLYSCLFLHSTLPAIGLFPIAVYLCLKNRQKTILKSELKNSFKSLITFQNTIGCFCIFIISYLYLSSNISGGKFDIFAFDEWYNCITWLIYFFLLEAGIYFILVRKIYKNNPIYYIALFSLLIFPFITIGSGMDFCMRATIPALIILYLMVSKTLLSKYYRKKYKLRYYILILTLIIGSITPIHEFARTIDYTKRGIIKAEPDLGFDNFYGWQKNNKFLKYFGKKLKQNNNLK